jgi:pimeloyl-ACP methyl ester carboxylesterase
MKRPALPRRSITPMAAVRLFVLTLSLLALAVPALSASLDGGPAPGSIRPAWKKAVVLVHGAFADGSCWDPVIRLLQARGVEVTAVQNPLNSLAGDVHAVNKVLNQQTKPVVLVGHSWGGVVITEGGQHPKVDSLVYVAAFAPGLGMSVNGLLSAFPPPPWLGDLRPDEDGYVVVTRKAYQQYFAQDLPSAHSLALSAAQVPTFGGTLHDTTTRAAWTAKPSWYVLAEQDRFIPPPLQEQMALQIGARVSRVAASHVVMISQPQKVVDAIVEALNQRR